jgi:hypothetical protein
MNIGLFLVGSARNGGIHRLFRAGMNPAARTRVGGDPGAPGQAAREGRWRELRRTNYEGRIRRSRVPVNSLQGIALWNWLLHELSKNEWQWTGFGGQGSVNDQ